MTQIATTWQRPLIIGASGQVGATLRDELYAQGAPEVLQTSRTPSSTALTLDLAALRSAQDAASVLGPVAPDLILCAGAMTYVDGCEEHQEQAFRANAYGPSAVAAYAHAAGVPFVFYSSDYVFDGTPEHPGPYSEDDAPAPLNVYGRSKLEGERAVLRVHPQALVLRTSWVYGPDAAGKNFITTLVRRLREGQITRVPEDQVSTPTFNKDLAGNTLLLLRAGMSGVVHATGPEQMNRLQLARHVAEFCGLDLCLVKGVPTSTLGQLARRPLQSGLISNRFSVASEVRFRSLAEGLRNMGASRAL